MGFDFDYLLPNWIKHQDLLVLLVAFAIYLSQHRSVIIAHRYHLCADVLPAPSTELFLAVKHQHSFLFLNDLN